MGTIFCVFLCLLCFSSAAKVEWDCIIKHNVTFGPHEEKFTICELKNVKFSVGKIVKFSSSVADFTYQQMRVKFIESSIQAIPNALFDELRKLEILEMNGVGLRNIFPQSFHRADELRIIQAYGNKLTQLGAYSFEGASNLEYLDVSTNKLSSIHVLAFTGLERLKELSLSNNRLSILDEHTFHPLINLTWIWLDRNEIKIISANLLVNSQKLEGLYLNDNKISALSTILFDKLPDLKFLFLANNNCTSSTFVNTFIASNTIIKKELSTCFKEFRTILPDEEDKFKFKNVLRDAEKANSQCESDKAALLERLEATKEQLANLQNKNGRK